MDSFACIVAAVVLGQSQIVVLQTEDEVSTNGEVQVSAAIDSNSILGMTGPGGLGDRPHLPTVRIKSDYDLDQDGDVDMRDWAGLCEIHSCMA